MHEQCEAHMRPQCDEQMHVRTDVLTQIQLTFESFSYVSNAHKTERKIHV